MARILAIDYGMKRTGLAVTDSQRIIATALETVSSEKLMDFLKSYFRREPVDQLVVGMPRRLNNLDTDMTQPVRELVIQLQEKFPDKPVALIDERFTSSIALQTMIDGGMKKKERRVKGNVDKISATLILQSYMESGGKIRILDSGCWILVDFSGGRQKQPVSWCKVESAPGSFSLVQSTRI